MLARARGRLLRCARIIEIYERNAHWQTTHTRTPNMNAQRAYMRCIAACEMRNVFLHTFGVCLCVCVVAHPTSIHPSVRPMRMHFRIGSMIQCLWILFENGYDKWLFISFNHGIVVSPCSPLRTQRIGWMAHTRCLRHSSSASRSRRYTAHSALFHSDINFGFGWTFRIAMRANV